METAKAISPEQVYDGASQRMLVEVNNVVANINVALSTTAEKGGRHIFGVARLGSTEPIRDRVVQLYRQAGWTIDVTHDLRDGNFYEFTRKSR